MHQLNTIPSSRFYFLMRRTIEKNEIREILDEPIVHVCVWIWLLLGGNLTHHKVKRNGMRNRRKVNNRNYHYYDWQHDQWSVCLNAHCALRALCVFCTFILFYFGVPPLAYSFLSFSVIITIQYSLHWLYIENIHGSMRGFQFQYECLSFFTFNWFTWLHVIIDLFEFFF